MPLCWFCHDAAQIHMKGQRSRTVSIKILSKTANVPELSCPSEVNEKLNHEMRANPLYAISEQQMRRTACASAKSNQRLCYSLPMKYMGNLGEYGPLGNMVHPEDNLTHFPKNNMHIKSNLHINNP